MRACGSVPHRVVRGSWSQEARVHNLDASESVFTALPRRLHCFPTQSPLPRRVALSEKHLSFCLPLPLPPPIAPPSRGASAICRAAIAESAAGAGLHSSTAQLVATQQRGARNVPGAAAMKRQQRTAPVRRASKAAQQILSPRSRAAHLRKATCAQPRPRSQLALRCGESFAEPPPRWGRRASAADEAAGQRRRHAMRKWLLRSTHSALSGHCGLRRTDPCAHRRAALARRITLASQLEAAA